MISKEKIEQQHCQKFKTRKTKIPANLLKENLFRLMTGHGISPHELPDDIPRKWEKHGDLVLIPANSLNHSIWNQLGDEVWSVVATSLNCQRVARKHVIKNNDYRSSGVQLLKGSDGWVTRADDGIKITFDVTKCMFSAGNISEKLRISKLNCVNETIVDLYAGIGYFTLPYLVHAKAARVHACEWNPDAVEALRRNLKLNNVEDRCFVHVGDNREVCPKGVADRVNLGLIPSSELSWSTACEALKPSSGGILHVHGLITSGLEVSNQISENDKALTVCAKSKLRIEWFKYAEETVGSIRSILKRLYQQDWTVNILHIEHVKSYAPRIYHLVIDVKCLPPCN